MCFGFLEIQTLYCHESGLQMKGKSEGMIGSDELKAKSVSEVFSDVKYQQFLWR